MGGKRHGGQKTRGQKAGGQKAWGAKGRGAKGRGAKDRGAKDRGAKDRGAKVLSPIVIQYPKQMVQIAFCHIHFMNRLPVFPSMFLSSYCRKLGKTSKFSPDNRRKC